MSEPRPSVSGEELLAHGRFLRSIAQSLVSDPDRADDLLQETWAVALERPPREHGALAAWLTRVLRSLAVTRGVREGQRSVRESAAARPESSADSGVPQEPDEIAAELEAQRLVVAGLQRLREPYRTTLYLRYYRDLGPTAIAEREGVPVKTVKTRLARGLELLREELDRRHGGDRTAWIALLLPMARAAPGPPVLPTREAQPWVAGPLAKIVLATGAVLSGSAAILAVLAALRGTGARDALPGAAPAAGSDPAQVDRQAGTSELDVSSAGARTALDTNGAATEGALPGRVLLRGRVIDAAGDPIPAAEVVGVGLRGARSGPASRAPDEDRTERGAWPASMGDGASAPNAGARTTTGQDGSFALDLAEVEPTRGGLVRLDVESDGFAPLGRWLFVPPVREHAIEPLVLASGVRLSGRVLDELGRPVAGVEVWQERFDEGLALRALEARSERVTRTDERGAFTILRQAVGPWSLQFVHSGHVPERVRGETTWPGQIVDEIELELEVGASVTGRVTGLSPNEAGALTVLARVRDEEVELGSARRPPAGASARAAVAEDGRFELRGLQSNAVLELEVQRAHASGRWSRASAVVSARAGEAQVELALAPRFSLIVRAVDAESGAGLARAEVVFAGAREDEGGREEATQRSPRSSEALDAASGGDGRFRIDGLRVPRADEPLELVLRAPGHRSQRLADLRVPAGGVLDLGTIALQPSPGQEFEVRSARTDTPIAGARLQWLEDGTAVLADEHGRARLALEPDRPGTLLVGAAGFAERVVVPFDAGTEAAREGDAARRVIELELGSSVEIEVTDPHGAPSAGALVERRAEEGSPARERARAALVPATLRAADERGVVRWEGLAPGRHAFRTASSGLSAGSSAADDRAGTWTEVDVAAGSVARMTLACRPEVSLIGTVRVDGTPLAGARLLLRLDPSEAGRAWPRFAHSASTDAAGRFAFADLAAGPARLELRHGSRALADERALRLEDGANELRIDLGEVRAIGFVRDSTGGPLRGARVRVLTARGADPASALEGLSSRGSADEPGVLTDATGRFAVSGLEAGASIVLEVSADGFAALRTPPFQAAEASAEHEITLLAESRAELALVGPADAGARTFLLIARALGADAELRPGTARIVRADQTTILSGLAQGKWRIELVRRSRPSSDGPHVLAALELDLRPGEQQRAELRSP
jgi:RNA polymerase sigma-70 factor (ECF subfamily)